MNGDDSTGSRFCIIFSPAQEVNLFASMCEKFFIGDAQCNHMIQMHSIKKTFDNWHSADIDRAQSSINCWPCRTYESIWHDTAGCQVIWQCFTRCSLMVDAQVCTQSVRRTSMSKWLLSLLLIRWSDDFWHVHELVTRDSSISHTSSCCEHSVYMLRQAVAIHDRHAAWLIRVDIQWNDDVAYSMLGQTAIWIVIPVGIQMDIQIKLQPSILLTYWNDLIEAIFCLGLVCRIIHNVTNPRNGWSIANEVICSTRISQNGVRFFNAFSILCDTVDARLLETTENVSNWLILCGDTCDRNWTRNDTNRICAIARIFRLPQLILPPPAQQITINNWHEWHWLWILTAQSWEPCSIRWSNCQLACSRICLSELIECSLSIAHIVNACEN